MNKEIINIVREIAKNLGDYAEVKRIVGDKNNIRVWGGIDLPGWEPLTTKSRNTGNLSIIW